MVWSPTRLSRFGCVVAHIASMSSSTDHYAVLNVPRSATALEIRAAYKVAARSHHPDKGGDAAAFQQIQRAFECLSHGERRREYDRTHAARGGRRPRYDKDLDASPLSADRAAAARKEAAALPVLLVCEVGIDSWTGLSEVMHHAAYGIRAYTHT